MQGFPTSAIFEQLDLAGVECVVAMAKNAVVTCFDAVDLAAL